MDEKGTKLNIRARVYSTAREWRDVMMFLLVFLGINPSMAVIIHSGFGPATSSCSSPSIGS